MAGFKASEPGLLSTTFLDSDCTQEREEGLRRTLSCTHTYVLRLFNVSDMQIHVNNPEQSDVRRFAGEGLSAEGRIGEHSCSAIGKKSLC